MLAEVKNICIIEDEEDIAESIKTFFESNGYSVIVYPTAEEFYSQKEDFKGIYLIDWNLPGVQGVDIIKKIRNKDKVSPIFIVSAFSEQNQIIEGLSSGADDYITKPFNLNELLARVRNSLKKFSIVDSNMDGDDIKLLPEAKSFIKDKSTISLTSKEYKIFESLFKNPNSPLSRDQLVEILLQNSENEKILPRNIDVHIFSLRKKIKPVDLMIETVWGKGYKLNNF